ncbi:MAG: glutathione S-transferase N-terminal domain-containing protein [Candidatus Marinimicrobia bacterium]|nr:glutathione S-transferase N-terminal domain-containing protein [Candidatus Neomarinimicrobiota bacterium]MCF7850795.1 glutathione S-transferase N-terminal domain-containing protein [Candidatus Neomarinimicrobiota bacterium]MCF7904795.1 glutathione S-transferase N-terminal domain-containing protein [Candidatus Neomarinimicrobiota bacterium]
MATVAAQQKKVIMFTTPTCSHCTTAKRYLREKGINFKEIDVSRNQKAAQDMVRKTGQQGVPQLWINNRPVVGFDRNKINRLLGI